MSSLALVLENLKLTVQRTTKIYFHLIYQLSLKDRIPSIPFRRTPNPPLLHCSKIVSLAPSSQYQVLSPVISNVPLDSTFLLEERYIHESDEYSHFTL